MSTENKNNTFKIITLNAGLLEYDLINHSLFTPVKFVKERLLSLPDKLLDQDADIIALQEVYRIKHKDFLIEKLSKTYPYSFHVHKGFRFSMENSLMIFSKVPFGEFSLHDFKRTRVEEYLFAKTGYLKMNIKIGDLKVGLYNVHFTAGGLLGPEHKKAEELRSHQIDQLLNDIKQNGITDNIIVGDFNCGPNVSINNYNKFLEAGFISLDSSINTWDPKNPLNINGIHKDSPEQSIDHILINCEFSLKSESSNLKLIFKEANIITQKMAVTLSDHYGISLEL